MKNAKYFFHLIFVVFLLLASAILCFLGSYFFNADTDWLIILFGEKEALSANFTPSAALFSAISAVATAYLLFVQISFSHKQKQDEQIRIFENKLFQIFSMRAEVIKSLKYDDGTTIFRGIDVCEVAYKMLNFYFAKYSQIDDVKYTYKYKVNDESGPEMAMLIDENGETVVPDLMELIKIILDYIDEKTRFVLYPYYHNIYITLKIIDEFPLFSEKEKRDYIRMFRSQISQFEFCLLYYHVLIHKDKNSGESKFKDFVENCAFFHTTSETMLFYQFNTNDFEDGYEETAFKHPEEIANEASNR